ncbi:energy transducer TonB [Flavobacteriales bacterium]|nr:energy transducer TonB [Flavobacteriales bacterium]
MKKILLILFCLPMLAFGQTDLTYLLFQLIDSKDTRNVLENEDWRTNSVNNKTDEYDVSYNEFKLSKLIDFSEGNSSRGYFTIQEYSSYSNIITLKVYDKSFYNQFKKIIVNSAYKKTSQDVASNIIQTAYKKTPLEITFREVLNNYYLITLLNYQHKENKAQIFTKAMLDLAEDIILLEPEIEDTESDEEEAIEIIDEDDEKVLMVVENMPKFPGGNLALMRYIGKNVKYPSICKEYNITGKVYVSYIVDKQGEVTNVKIVRGVDKNLDAEAVRVVKSLPKYTPGTQRGKPVRVMFTMPINFTLN